MGQPPEGGGLRFICLLVVILHVVKAQDDYGCPPQEKILPCRCSTRDMEFQIWCSHSELPKVLAGLSAVSRFITHPVDELILENNNLPSLPGKVFTSLRVLRLMLRNNRLERVSSGWLEGLHDSLLELFLVEPDLRSLPVDSLDNLQGLEAITIQSRSMKRLPRFSGLSKLRYLQVNSPTLVELSPMNFRDLPNLEQLHLFGSPKLMRLEAGLFRSLPKLTLINITDSSIAWIHPRAFVDLPELREISFENNKIPDASIVGRALTDLTALSILKLDGNKIVRLQEESFIDLPSLNRLYLARNLITEILPGAFQMLPMLRVLDLNHNLINRIHPEFFIQRTGSGLEELWIINNHLNHVNELRAIFEALPRLKFLDVSYNHLEEIPFGALRGHPTLERLHLDHNRLTFLQRETFSTMPALRELRLKNNSLTNLLEAPFWNLPGLKGLDLSENYFRHIEPILLANLPNLRRLDLSGNGIASIEPSSFMDTPALEHLNLSGNAIAVIHPMTMRHLTGLYELDVGWNRLLEVVPALPKNIEHLHLPMNRIVELPALETQDLVLPALRSLDLSANGIERIPPGAVSELPSLRKLNLGYNSLRLLEDRTFDGLVRLEQLDMQHNRLMSLHGRSFRPLRSLMDLNLRGNRLEVVRSDIFTENVQLQRLDLARNNLAQIPHLTFSNTRDLRELYASHNTLTELPGSLHGLGSLEVLDLSFNKLNILSPETLSSLTSLLELKLVRNKIKELREGAFNRLPRLSFIDLENNELRVIERNAIKNLPELQAIRLGKNRIQAIPTGAFTDLPLLQSAELQENRIQEIAVNAFTNVPNLLLLNLSFNLLPSLEHAGLTNLRSLEVLDVSNNRLTRVTSHSLAAMEWLVELKMDNNRICGIDGTPFDNMPRLRVLSMRSNRMPSVSENAFKRLRSNIAILDIDGNPLSCSCAMLWLRGWLQQSSSDGPRCADGSYFRDMRLSRQDCLQKKQQEPVHPGCDAEMIDESLMSPSHYTDGKPPPAWMNMHKLSEEQDQFYMYDYPDNENINDDDELSNQEINRPTKSPTTIINSVNGPIKFVPTSTTSPKTPGQTSNTHNKKKNPAIPPSPGSSGFTFFGVPLPNLNFNLWGNSGKKSLRKDETNNSRPGRSRYRTFPPTEPEIHRGGFVPLPQSQGGFTPIVNPRFVFPKRPKNDSATTHGNRTAMITRVYQATRKKINEKKSINDEGKIKHKNNEEITDVKTDTSVLSSVTEIRRVPSNVTKKIESLETNNIPTDNSSNDNISALVSSTQKNNNANIDADSDETVILEGKIANVASKIVWTTPKSSLDIINSTESSTIKSEQQTQQKNIFWDSTEDQASLVKPSITTPMSPEISNRTIFLITTENSIGNSTIMSDMNANEQISTFQTSRALEASALSALLIPGGQVPISGPMMISRPSGRSSIEKIPSPHLSRNYSINDDVKFISNETIEKGTLFDIDIIESSSTQNANIMDDDDRFNWYFQNYNESNLEPYVGVAYSGNGSITLISFRLWIVFILQIFFILRT
ncbi:hypothetical protein PV328_009695 [Microctonus aethiopoides]|uniref:Chaoptin n=1 Tax=Microctonus aethiopoides TaxID=144406 RepID=A0AA39C6F6_9HYME|nr:hypothetical protein PV328_009695 [Microctonus aethiopoides]